MFNNAQCTLDGVGLNVVVAEGAVHKCFSKNKKSDIRYLKHYWTDDKNKVKREKRWHFGSIARVDHVAAVADVDHAGSYGDRYAAENDLVPPQSLVLRSRGPCEKQSFIT